MPILNNIEISLNPEKIALSLNRGRENKNVIQGLTEALDEAVKLWNPLALYRVVEVVGVTGETIKLVSEKAGREVTLRLGPKADIMAPAEKAVISVSTIGPALGEEVDRLNKAGQMLESYFLDSVGVTGLGEVGRAVRLEVERLAREMGFGVGPSLAPGSLVGWPVSGQGELLSLLDLETIGVVLNPHGLLVPFKSASGFIGLGREFPSQRVGSVCKYCSLADTCWRRRKDPE